MNYSGTECRRIARHSSGEIEALLGYIDEPRLIRRGKMIVR